MSQKAACAARTACDEAVALLKSRLAPSQPECNTPPPKTTINKTSAPPERVQRALRVLQAAVASIREGRDIKLRDGPARTHCGDH